METRFQIPEGQFGAIYVDPPWEHDDRQNARRRLHYDRMTLDELAEIPITDSLHPDGHLWLWSTTTHMPLAFKLLDAWGIPYRTMAVWKKEGRLGLGWWLRSQHEFLIFAARTTLHRHNPGNFTTELRGKYLGHSIKPVEAYDYIESLSPGPFLELFSRSETPRAGWTTLGSSGVPSEPYNATKKLIGKPDVNDGVVRGVGGLEIHPMETYHYLERIIVPKTVVALKQTGRRVQVEIDGKKKMVSIDRLRAVTE